MHYCMHKNICIFTGPLATSVSTTQSAGKTRGIFLFSGSMHAPDSRQWRGFNSAVYQVVVPTIPISIQIPSV